MKVNEEVQQGDVIIKRIPDNFDLDRGKKLNHKVLAEGEVTGHSHRLTQGLGSLIMLDKILYMEIFEDNTKLEHNTHNPIMFNKGKYQIGIVREKDHFKDIIREVVD